MKKQNSVFNEAFNIIGNAIRESQEEAKQYQKDYYCERCNIELNNDELDWRDGDTPICPECNNKIEL